MKINNDVDVNLETEKAIKGAFENLPTNGPEFIVAINELKKALLTGNSKECDFLAFIEYFNNPEKLVTFANIEHENVENKLKGQIKAHFIDMANSIIIDHAKTHNIEIDPTTWHFADIIFKLMPLLQPELENIDQQNLVAHNEDHSLSIVGVTKNNIDEEFNAAMGD